MRIRLYDVQQHLFNSPTWSLSTPGLYYFQDVGLQRREILDGEDIFRSGSDLAKLHHICVVCDAHGDDSGTSAPQLPSNRYGVVHSLVGFTVGD